MAIAPDTPVRRMSGSFSRRILGVMALVLAVALAGSAMGVSSLYRVSEETQRMVDEAMVTERLAGDLRRHLELNVARSKALALSSEPQVGEALMQEIAPSATAVASLMSTLQGRMAAPQDQLSFQHMAQANSAFLTAREALITARDGGLTAHIEQVYGSTFLPAAQVLLAAVTRLQESRHSAIAASVQHINAVSLAARQRLIWFGLAAVVLAGGLSLWLVRGVTLPMAVAVDTAHRVAALDLSVPIAGHERDEGGQLLTALSRMQHALHTLVAQVQGASAQVAAGAAQIAMGNQDLSRRTELTASFLQQTASVVAQISSTLQQSLDATAQGDALVQSAGVQAGDGSQVMSEVMHTMQAISASSRRIEDITGVIDAIAFQTNILALNAAVEAARAGTAGRGFAVVAAEVRALANRSAAAAQEIKALIGASAQQVEQGAQRVHHARDSMSTIVHSVQQLAASMGEIRAQAGEQSAGMSRIRAAVGQLDTMTQQNAAAVQESAAAAHSLQGQASELRDAVARFQLPGMAVPVLLQAARQKLGQTLAFRV